MILVIISLMLVIYAYYLWWVVNRWNNISEPNIPLDYKPRTKIGVIIPVRNEAKHIQKCIESLLDNEFPDKLLELIIIDDYSEDNTVDIIKSINHPSIKLLHLKDYLQDKEINAYKKIALEYGINNTSAELIITTDGDSYVNSKYLQTYSYYYENFQPLLIAGPVQFFTSSSFVEQFQEFDMMTMMGITAAGISSQKYYMANGANLAFDKEAYLTLAPFKPNDTASGDDMFLIQTMAKQYPDSVHFLKSKSAIVHTALTSGLSKFLQQRKRWASKSKQYNEPNIKLLMIFIAIVNLLPIGVIIVWSITRNYYFGIIGLSYIGIKFVIDRWYIGQLTTYFDSVSKLRNFYKSYIFYYLYICYTGIVGIFPSKYEWKSRKVK